MANQYREALLAVDAEANEAYAFIGQLVREGKVPHEYADLIFRYVSSMQKIAARALAENPDEAKSPDSARVPAAQEPQRNSNVLYAGTGYITRICAWCEKRMGFSEADPDNDGRVSHGICDDCQRDLDPNTGMP